MICHQEIDGPLSRYSDKNLQHKTTHLSESLPSCWIDTFQRLFWWGYPRQNTRWNVSIHQDPNDSLKRVVLCWKFFVSVARYGTWPFISCYVYYIYIYTYICIYINTLQTEELSINILMIYYLWYINIYLGLFIYVCKYKYANRRAVDQYHQYPDDLSHIIYILLLIYIYINI